MKLHQTFDPIQVGEVDSFAFDFQYDIGGALIIGGTFNCALAPFQKINDPSPQNHVLSVSLLTQIALRVPPGGQLIMRSGNYVVGLLGGFTNDMVGGVYVLQATANLSDGRVLELNSTVRCIQTGT